MVTGTMRLLTIWRMIAIDWRYCHRLSGSGLRYADLRRDFGSI
jgi:hypothetical protein